MPLYGRLQLPSPPIIKLRVTHRGLHIRDTSQADL
jgi:hypothetical protein